MLAAEEQRAKAIDRQLAELDQRSRIVPLDWKHLEARLKALGRDVRGVLAAGGPEARRLLQRVLNGRRVACEPFRKPGRRGYRFRATGTYAGALSNDVGFPLGPPVIESRVSGNSRAIPRHREGVSGGQAAYEARVEVKPTDG